MAKRFMTLLIIAGLLGGTSGLAEAYGDDFETRGSLDYLPRVVVFGLHPVGVVLNQLIFKPIGYLACFASDLTGCTPEEQRALGLGGTYQEIPSEPTQ